MENRYPNGYFDMENGIWIHHLIFRVSNFQPNHGWCMVCLYALYMYHWDQTNWRWKAESNLTKWVGVKIGSPKCPKGLSEFSSLNGWYMLGIYPMFRHTHIWLIYDWYPTCFFGQKRTRLSFAYEKSWPWQGHFQIGWRMYYIMLIRWRATIQNDLTIKHGEIIMKQNGHPATMSK